MQLMRTLRTFFLISLISLVFFAGCGASHMAPGAAGDTSGGNTGSGDTSGDSSASDLGGGGAGGGPVAAAGGGTGFGLPKGGAQEVSPTTNPPKGDPQPVFPKRKQKAWRFHYGRYTAPTSGAIVIKILPPDYTIGFNIKLEVTESDGEIDPFSPNYPGTWNLEPDGNVVRLILVSPATSSSSLSAGYCDVTVKNDPQDGTNVTVDGLSADPGLLKVYPLGDVSYTQIIPALHDCGRAQGGLIDFTDDPSILTEAGAFRLTLPSSGKTKRE